MKKTHKFVRNLLQGDQFRLCTGEKVNFSESDAYRWKRVTCARCKGLRRLITFGIYEEIRCAEGQVMERVVPHLRPGGIVTHYSCDCLERVCQ